MALHGAWFDSTAIRLNDLACGVTGSMSVSEAEGLGSNPSEPDTHASAPWCNGSMGGFEPLGLGSNPGARAN